MSRNKQNDKSESKAAAKAEPDRTDARGTVTVGCRIPTGLRVENIPGIGTVMFKGSNDKRALIMADEYGYHGITTGVPQEAWDYIVNHPVIGKSKAIKSGAIFAATKSKDAIKEAQDRGDHNVGFNGLDPDDLPAKIEDAARAE